MPGALRTVAMGLLLSMAAALSGVPATASIPSRADHPAGCHGRAPAVPSPAPTSYQCCVSGHDAALPNPAFALSLTSAAVQLSSFDAGNKASLDFVTFLHSTISVPFLSPPGGAPLRI